MTKAFKRSLIFLLIPVFCLALAACPLDGEESSIVGVWNGSLGIVELRFTEDGLHTASTLGLSEREATYTIDTSVSPALLTRRWHRVSGVDVEPFTTYAIFRIIADRLTIGTNTYNEVGFTADGDVEYLSESESNRPASLDAAELVVVYVRDGLE